MLLDGLQEAWAEKRNREDRNSERNKKSAPPYSLLVLVSVPKEAAGEVDRESQLLISRGHGD